MEGPEAAPAPAERPDRKRSRTRWGPKRADEDSAPASGHGPVAAPPTQSQELQDAPRKRTRWGEDKSAPLAQGEAAQVSQ